MKNSYNEKFRLLVKPKFGFPSLHTDPSLACQVQRKVQMSNDYSEYFTSDRVFSDRNEVIGWAKATAIEHNFYLKIGRDKKSSWKSYGKTWLQCERAGTRTPIKEMTKRASTTKKCGCPFTLTCIEKPRGSWKIIVVTRANNHPIGDDLYGNALAGRPTPEEEKVVKMMTLSGCKPKSILTHLNKSPMNFTKQKQVYNEIYKVRSEMM